MGMEVSPELPANDLFNLLDTERNGNLTLDQLVEGMLNLRRGMKICLVPTPVAAQKPAP